MTEEQRKKLSGQIIDLIAETEEKIQSLEISAAPVAPDSALGRLSRMEAIQDRSVAEAALVRTKDELIRLENALQNVFRPDFGICTACKGEISFARMEALPQSTHCVKCAR